MKRCALVALLAAAAGGCSDSFVLDASVDAGPDTGVDSAGDASVARGHAKTLSAWVNEALRLKVDHEGRLDALAAFVSAYEREHGEISAEEMRVAARRASARAVRSRTLAESKPHEAPGKRAKPTRKARSR